MKEIGIYVHIPFCKQKCYYCDFKSYANKERLIEEYIKWLEFKNYLKTNSLDELDISSLENYATYAYALDEYDNFLVALNKKYLKDEHVFDKSILLSIMNFRIFDEVEEVLRKSIKIARNKYVFLFKRNKGRKI